MSEEQNSPKQESSSRIITRIGLSLVSFLLMIILWGKDYPIYLVLSVLAFFVAMVWSGIKGMIKK